MVLYTIAISFYIPDVVLQLVEVSVSLYQKSTFFLFVQTIYVCENHKHFNF